ncbi:hypothetical protein SFRURICE_019685 [Spodoptera frugiperda]|uniref:SFRICE_009369 n=1 Tax=Spodoptera frugiperda TaxID=7108 RepID=A0A2H1WYX1_SPOFR|nr:hypothetical protein SFRURICE_019685 [Spodoptera frugiperda]
MKTSLECERAETAESGGKGRISFSVDSLLGGRQDAPVKDTAADTNSNDAESTDAAPESDESDVDIEDVDSNVDDREERENGHDGEELETRGGVVVPQPLLPRLYQGPPPHSWPFGAFPWMAPNPMFRGGSPNSKCYYKHTIKKIEANPSEL